MHSPASQDEQAIYAIITGLFDAISWDVDSPPDWQTFRAHFHPEARLFPSARPSASRSLDEFVEMMDQQYHGQMRSFSETALQTTIHSFGNIATAIGAYSSEINGGAPSRGVNIFSFVRESGIWKVASMCWDGERDDSQIPDRF